MPSCSIPEELRFGKELHSCSLKCGFTCCGVSAINTLILKSKTKVTERPATRNALILGASHSMALLFYKVYIKIGLAPSGSVTASSIKHPAPASSSHPYPRLLVPPLPPMDPGLHDGNMGCRTLPFRSRATSLDLSYFDVNLLRRNWRSSTMNYMNPMDM